MFEPTTDQDVPDIVTLMNRAYRSSGTSAGWNTEAGYLSGDRTTADLLRADIRAKPAASLLKWSDPEGAALIGCVWLEPLEADAWYLGPLAAEPTRQQRGLGRTLLAAAEAWVLERGGRRVRMTVINVRESLIAW